MDATRHKQNSGNRCGHDPQNPRLSPPTPIRKGPGGLPRILSLAAEKAKEWYFTPSLCPPLQISSKRQTRSERREAYQIVLEFFLSRLDLATLCLGTPTLDKGFIDLDMKTIVAGTGLRQRRCERAIDHLKQAGFMVVKQPRYKNPEGHYRGLRAIRVLTARLFEWLNLGSMLARERARASKALRDRGAKFGLNLSDMFKRMLPKTIRPVKPENPTAPRKIRELWNNLYIQAIRNGTDYKEAQHQINTRLGYPQDWSPGKVRPKEEKR